MLLWMSVFGVYAGVPPMTTVVPVIRKTVCAESLRLPSFAKLCGQKSLHLRGAACSNSRPQPGVWGSRGGGGEPTLGPCSTAPLLVCAQGIQHPVGHRWGP